MKRITKLAIVFVSIIILGTFVYLGLSKNSTDSYIKSSQEIISKRSEYAKVYANGNNQEKMEIFSEPINYKDNKGNWQEINTTIEKSNNQNYGYESTKNQFQTYFNKTSKSDYLVKYETKGASIEFGIIPNQTWGNINNCIGYASGNQIIYPEIFKNIDLSYKISSQQLLEEFTVKSPNTVNSIQNINKIFRLSGVSYKMRDDGGIDFVKNGSNDILWTIPKPVLYEQNHPEVNNYSVHFEITKEEDHSILTKVIDPSGLLWLKDPNRKYPVVIDDTLVLGDSALTNGMVLKNGASYTRNTSSVSTAVGYNASVTYRAFQEWSTASIPSGITIQSVGLFLDVNAAYGSGNTVSIKKMPQNISFYSNDTTGNTALFTDISTASAYLATNQTQTVGFKFVTLAYDTQAGTTLIADLEAAKAASLPFTLGFLGSNETTAYSSWVSKQGTADLHPALVIVYSGIKGSNSALIEPTRTSFYDGTYFWQFVNADSGIYYYYSSDGTTWTVSNRLTTDSNKHFSVWYDNNHTVYAAYSHLPAGNPAFDYDIEISKGTISSTTILWDTAVTAFTSNKSASLDGYDFPSIVLDSNRKCWVMARHYNGSSPTTSGVEIVSSVTNLCSTWNSSTSLIGYTSSTGNYLDRGGYVIPLTSGKVYAVYKDTDGTHGQIYGKLFDGASWGIQETIDNSTALGIGTQGMSDIAISDTVHLIYIASDNSLKYLNRSSSWSAAITLDNSATFYTPSLTYNSSNGTLYAFYRTASSNDIGNASVFYKIGSSPFAIGNWAVATALVNGTAWGPETLLGTSSVWNLTSNYSGNNVVFETLQDGIYGLTSKVVVNSPVASPTVSTSTDVKLGAYVSAGYTDYYCYSDMVTTPTSPQTMHSVGLKDVGVQFSWETINWSQIQSSSSTYSFNFVDDKIIIPASNCGIEMGVHLSSNADWATGGPHGNNHSYPPLVMNDYYNFVYNTVLHYNHNFPGVVTRYSVENEAAASSEWEGTPAQYAELLQEARLAIDAANTYSRTHGDSFSDAKLEDSSLSSSVLGISYFNDLLKSSPTQSTVDEFNDFFAKYGGLGNALHANTVSDLQTLFDNGDNHDGTYVKDSFAGIINTWVPMLKVNQVYDIQQLHYFGPWKYINPMVTWIKSNFSATRPIDWWEFGYGYGGLNGQEDYNTATPNFHAQELVRLFASAIGNTPAGGMRIVQHTFADFDYVDGHPGLLNQDGSVRPAETAYLLLTSNLNGATKSAELDYNLNNDGIYAYSFVTPRDKVAIIWADSNGSKYDLNIGHKQITQTVFSDTTTTNSSVYADDLTVGVTPIFLTSIPEEPQPKTTPTSTPTPVLTSATAPSSGNTVTNNAVCRDSSPGTKPPWLYGAIPQDSQSILLYFTPGDNPINKYVLEYGTSSGNYQYGVQDMGVSSRDQMTYLVKSLSPNNTYYFRIRGGNGCATGPWSNEISSSTRPFISTNNLNIVTSDLNPKPEENTPGNNLNNPPSSPSPTQKPSETKSYELKVKVSDIDNKPVKGADVIIHSNPSESLTDENGIADFKNIDPGQHKVLISYNGYKGEQSIDLQGGVKEFDLNIKIQQENPFSNRLILIIIGSLSLIIIILIFLLFRFVKRKTV